MNGLCAPGVVKCVMLLALTDAALRLLGFQRTLRIAHRLGRRSRLATDQDVLGETISRVIVATALYPGRAKCLEQSIVNLILLRRRGFAVQLRIGVQPYPFQAHAWVEESGRAITDSPENIGGYALLADVPV